MAPRGPFATEASKSSPSAASTLATPNSRSGGRGSAASDISERSGRSGRSSRSSTRGGNGRIAEGYGTGVDDSSSIYSDGGRNGYPAEGYGTGVDYGSSVQSSPQERGGRVGYAARLSDTASDYGYGGSTTPPHALDSTLRQEGVNSDKVVSGNDRVGFVNMPDTPSTVSTERIKRTNKAEVSASMGNLEGYHGVRPSRMNTNKRLFGLSPCMRSCVDEVVFGRDVDGSTSKDHSAETHYLLSLYEAAAGGHRGAAALLIDAQDDVPDKERPPALRPAHRIESAGLDGYAGLRTNQRGAGCVVFPNTKPIDDSLRCPNGNKRAWRHLPMSKSTVAEVVYQHDIQPLTSHDTDMLGQFGHSAGKSPRIRHGALNEQTQHTDSKRNYHHSPMNKATLERMVSNTEVRPSPPGKEEHLLKQFEQAAGISERFQHDPKSRKARLTGALDPSFCVFRTPESRR